MDMLSLLKSRHSVRAYNYSPLSEEIIRFLNAEISLVNSLEAGLHFSLVTDSSEAFDGISKSYGMFKGVRNYIAAVIEPSYPYTYERAGYFAQQIVIKAVEKDLGTCFVGGTFDSKSVPVQMRAGYKIPFVVTLGYPADNTQTLVSGVLAKFIHRKKRKPEDFFVPEDLILEEAEILFPKLNQGLEALTCAPSSLNLQPVRISAKRYADQTKLIAFLQKKDTVNLIDLGIAKYNMAAVMDGVWEWGDSAPLLF